MIIYNEIDKFAAAWLRELSKANLIAPGEVWEDDIQDIRPIDLKGVVQFHGFAGIGGWSYALRRAGWPDTRPAWSLSCPCQPFSAAGKGAGFDDERHLWPAAYHLVSQCRPAVIFGEQVASKAVDPWIDLVHADLEAVDYAFGSIPFPSAGVGAPHIRDRNYWMAYTNRQRRAGLDALLRAEDGERRTAHRIFETTRRGKVVGLDSATGGGRQRFGSEPEHGQSLQADEIDIGGLEHAEGDGRQQRRSEPGGRGAAAGRSTGGLADAESSGRSGRSRAGRGDGSEAVHDRGDGRPGPTNGFWRDPDWLFCRDDKWRPVEPGTFPLAHGATARVGRLRGYGNAINAEAATAFIEAYLESQAIDG